MQPFKDDAATISVWNVSNGRLQRSVVAGDWVSNVVFSRSGDYVIATSGMFQKTGSVLVVNLQSGETKTLIPEVSAEEVAVFSTDLRWLASTDGNDIVRLWKLSPPD